MISSLTTKNIRIGTKRTSVRLEPNLWKAMEEVCQREKMNMNDLCTKVSENMPDKGGFTSALRVYILEYYRKKLADSEQITRESVSAMRHRVVSPRQLSA